jgi:hypothetical protein
MMNQRHASSVAEDFTMSPELKHQPLSASRPRSRGGFPLSALFVLVTIVAVLAAMLSPLARSGIDGRWAGGGMALCAIAGLVAGAVAGTFRRPSWLFVLIGTVIGLALGLFIGPLAGAHIAALPAILAACFGGAVAIVVVGVFVRLAERRRELPALAASHEAQDLSHDTGAKS